MDLVVDQQLEFVAFRETLRQAIPVLVGTLGEIVRDPRVECPTGYVGNDVNEVRIDQVDHGTLSVVTIRFRASPFWDLALACPQRS